MEGTKRDPDGDFRVNNNLPIVPVEVDIAEILEMEEHLKSAAEIVKIENRYSQPP